MNKYEYKVLSLPWSSTHLCLPELACSLASCSSWFSRWMTFSDSLASTVLLLSSSGEMITLSNGNYYMHN